MPDQGVSERLPSPDGRTAPPKGYKRWDDYMADVEADEAARHDIALSRRLTKAMRLSGGDLLVFEALIADQPVPHDAMDQEWLRRYR